MLKIITEYIKDLEKDGVKSNSQIAEVLGVSNSMVSAYRTGSYNPSLEVGTRVYKSRGVVLHPYSEESLNHEILKWSRK